MKSVICHENRSQNVSFRLLKKSTILKRNRWIKNKKFASVYKILLHIFSRGEGYAVAQLVEALHYKPEGHGFDSFWFTGIFYSRSSSGHTMALGFDSASHSKEHQGYFLRVKGSRSVGLTKLPLSCADCFDIWEPQTPGTLGACPGL